MFQAAKKQLGLRPQAPGSDDGADILVSCPVENQSSVMSLAKTTSGSAGSQQPEADVRRDHFNAEQEADLDSASLLHVPGSVSLLSQPDIV